MSADAAPALTAFLAHAAECPAFWVMGDCYTVLLNGAQTGGAFDLFEFRVPAGRGSPPHIHAREDETFYILEGEARFMVDGEVLTAHPGDVVFGARHIPHNFTNSGDADLRMMVMTTPSGTAGFFEAVGHPATDRDAVPPLPSADDIARMKEHAPLFGVRLVGDH